MRKQLSGKHRHLRPSSSSGSVVSAVVAEKYHPSAHDSIASGSKTCGKGREEQGGGSTSTELEIQTEDLQRISPLIFQSTVFLTSTGNFIQDKQRQMSSRSLLVPTQPTKPNRNVRRCNTISNIVHAILYGLAIWVDRWLRVGMQTFHATLSLRFEHWF